MTVFITNFFYLLSPLFIWVEIFGFLNRDRVYKRMDFETFEKSNLRLYFYFYFSKVFYLIWMLIGLFTIQSNYFIILILLGLFKFFILYTRKNILINLYDFLNPLISIIILIMIFIQVFFQ